MIDHKIAETVIKTNRRMTYTNVKKILADKDAAVIEEYKLLYSKRMNKPVIIATSTIALQEQLWRDVYAVMPLLGLNRDVILAKGQTHYVIRFQ